MQRSPGLGLSVSIPKRVSAKVEPKYQHRGSIECPVSIPKRVSAKVEHPAYRCILYTDVSIPKRVSAKVERFSIRVHHETTIGFNP